MSKTTTTLPTQASILYSNELILFNFFMYFYPKNYRKKFGEQMLILFTDLCQEEIEKNGKITFSFWIFGLIDIVKSITHEHIDYLQKYGFRKYFKDNFSVNKYNVIGVLLLLPFFSVFLIDAISRLLQRDLMHPNQMVLRGLYNTPLYFFPILFTWVFLFPIAAVVLNVIPLIKQFIRKTKTNNLITLLVLLFSLWAVFVVFFHDTIPELLQKLIR